MRGPLTRLLGTGGSRRRFFLRLLLLAPIAASLVLAVHSWRQSERYEAAVANALSQQASMLLAGYAQTLEARFWMFANAAFEGAASAPRERGEALLDRLERSIAAIPGCRCAPPISARALFWFDTGNGSQGFRALAPGAEPEVLAVLADLKRRTPRAAPPSPFLLHGGDTPRRWFAVYAIPAGSGPDGSLAYGALLDPAELGEHLFNPSFSVLHLNTARQAISGRDLERYLSIRVAVRERALLWQSAAQYASPFRATRPLFFDVSEIGLTLALNPALADDVITGGLPKSPLLGLAVIVATACALALLGFTLLRRAERLQADHEEFAARVSHELRTPLTQILLYAESLAVGHLASAEQRDRAVKIVLREARHLIHLADNALAFTRAGRSSAALAPRAQELAPLIEEAASALAPLLETNGARLVANLERGAACRVDAAAFRQILTNLIDNALRHGGKGQTLTLALATDQGQARLTLDDQGPGIPPGERERVFRPFVRLASRSTGSGLGLAIVRQLVEIFGGTVAAVDAPGGGARFEIRLPLASGDPA